MWGDLPEPNSRAHLVTSWGHVKRHKVNKCRSLKGETRVEAWQMGKPSRDHCGDWMPLLVYIFSGLSNLSKVHS